MAEPQAAEPKERHRFLAFPGNHPEVIREALLRRGNFIEAQSSEEETIENLSLIWRPVQYGTKMLSKIEKLNMARKYVRPLIFNHIEALKGVTSKVGLLRSLRRFYATHPSSLEHRYSINDSMALSFIYESGGDESEFTSFLQRYKEFSQGSYRKDQMPGKHCANNLWIVKPSNLNQGRGILVAKSLAEVKAAVANKPVHSLWVVQKYIERPLLYRERKFDIRVWVLVTDRADIFFYKSGYIRTSSNVYSLESSESYVHLTNNCLQQFGANYGKFEDGNTLSLDVLKEYLMELCTKHGISLNFEEHITGRMQSMILDTLFAVKTELIVSAKKRGCSFELLGYDFMIDEDLRVWLIEANTNPYLGIPNAYIRALLPRMLDDMFALVLDVSYPRSKTSTTGHRNDFELLYCEKGSAYSSEPVNKHRGYGKELLYPGKGVVPQSPARAETKLAAIRTLFKRVRIGKQQRGRRNTQTMVAYNSSGSGTNSHDNSCVAAQIHASTGELIDSKSGYHHVGNSNNCSTVVPNASPKKAVVVLKGTQKAGAGLEEAATELVKTVNFSGLQPLFGKLMSAVKESCRAPNPALDKEIISSVQSVAESKMIYAFLSENEGELRSLQRLALTLDSGMSQQVRLCLIELFSKMCGNAAMKRHMLNSEVLHLMLDLIVDDTAKEFALPMLKGVLKLVQTSKGCLYIPGQTLELEKEKVKLIQHGLVLVLVHLQLQLSPVAAELRAVVDAHLAQFYTSQELEWSLKLLAKQRATLAHIRDTSLDSHKPNPLVTEYGAVGTTGQKMARRSASNANTSQSRYGSIMETGNAKYLDLLQGKELMLSEQQFSHNEICRKCTRLDLEAVAERIRKMVAVAQKIELSTQLKLRQIAEAEGKKPADSNGIETIIASAKTMYPLLAKTDNKKSAQIAGLKRDLCENEKKLKDQELRRQKYMALLKDQAVDYYSKPMRKARKIYMQRRRGRNLYIPETTSSNFCEGYKHIASIAKSQSNSVDPLPDNPKKQLPHADEKTVPRRRHARLHVNSLKSEYTSPCKNLTLVPGLPEETPIGGTKYVEVQSPTVTANVNGRSGSAKRRPKTMLKRTHYDGAAYKIYSIYTSSIIKKERFARVHAKKVFA